MYVGHAPRSNPRPFPQAPLPFREAVDFLIPKMPLPFRRPLHNQRMPLSVILSEVSNANEAEGSRTGSRKRTRYRFLVREALTSCAKVSFQEGVWGRSRRALTQPSFSARMKNSPHAGCFHPSGKTLGGLRRALSPSPPFLEERGNRKGRKSTLSHCGRGRVP